MEKTLPGPFGLFVFDLDGTLVNSEAVSVPDMIAFLNDEYAVPIDIETWYANGYHGLAGDALYSKLHAEFGLVLDGPAFRTKRELRLPNLFAKGLPAAPGVEQALTTLKNSGAKMVVASNSSSHRIKLSFTHVQPPLGHLFGDNLISALEEGRRPKPAPDCYLEAAARYGMPPSRCLAVEDSVAGATAALTAGYTTIGYLGLARSPEHEAPEMAHIGCAALMTDWAEFPAILARLGHPL